MRALSLASIVGLILTCVGVVGAAHGTERGPTIVTVVGEITKTNRDAFDGFRDAFLKFREKNFAKAYGFSYAALQALPQHTVTANVEGWAKPVRGAGPKLADVLAAAGVASDAPIGVVALDGYTVEFEPKDRKARDWILAISADGEPLAIGGRGPAWLVYETKNAPASEDDEAKWVWSIFLIEAQ